MGVGKMFFSACLGDALAEEYVATRWCDCGIFGAFKVLGKYSPLGCIDLVHPPSSSS